MFWVATRQTSSLMAYNAQPPVSTPVLVAPLTNVELGHGLMWPKIILEPHKLVQLLQLLVLPLILLPQRELLLQQLELSYTNI